MDTFLENLAVLDDGDIAVSTRVIYNALDPEQLNGILPLRSAFHSAYPKAIREKVLK